jgi:hypothetical protein
MGTLDEPFSGLLVDASNGHGKRGDQHEASCFISTKADPGDDVDIVIGKAVAGIPTHMKECILKAGRAGEELFGIGRIAPSAKGLGGSASLIPCRPPLAVAFVEYRQAIGHMPSSLGFANLGTGRPMSAVRPISGRL